MHSISHHPHKLLVWLAALVLPALLASGCTTRSPASRAAVSLRAWQYADLRLIDPVDALQPAGDFLALYLRATPGSRQNSRLEIRLDLLSSLLEQPAAWLVALDHAPGGQLLLPGGSPVQRPWDSLLVISADSAITLLDTALQPRPGAAIRVLRNLQRRQIDISFNLSTLPAGRLGIWAQVFSTTGDPLSGTPLDSSLPAALHARPPEPVPVLLAFRDAFPAYTPAQALRRWDGAHTGPLGGRHGLFNLLRLARSHAIPIALLDLSAPESLSALDYAGGLALVRQMEEDRLLMLLAAQPDPASICQPVDARQAAAEFGVRLYPSNTSSLLSRAPLPPDTQIDDLGLTAQAYTLLANAGAQERRSPVLLGGSLPSSRWGVPEMARAALADIRARPWIRPLDGYSLQTWLPKGQLPARHNAVATGMLERAFQQACSALQAPLFPADNSLPALRSRYRGQLAVLQLAAAWERQPFTAASCSQDLDGDGSPECLLASETTLAVLQAGSAAISYLFVHAGGSAHQLVAPSSQLIVGQSDPQSWQLDSSTNSLLSDPAVIPGGFWQSGPCSSQVDHTGITFACRGVSLRYTLSTAGITLSIDSPSPVAAPELMLPLVFDPWQRFEPGWGSRFSQQQDGALRLGFQTGSLLQLSASLPYRVTSFDATRQLMGLREDPNTDFPPGHYLPFPLLLVEFPPTSRLEVLIELIPSPSGL